jgi:hypothetical protein
VNKVSKVFVGAILVSALAQCTTVAPIQSPAKYIAGNKPRTVWLTKSNHSVVRVDGPRMVGDTVVGAVSGEYTEIPLTDVTRASAIQADKGKTILAAVLGGGATIAAAAVIFSHGGSSNNGGADTAADTMTLQRQF